MTEELGVTFEEVFGVRSANSSRERSGVLSPAERSTLGGHMLRRFFRKDRFVVPSGFARKVIALIEQDQQKQEG